jgi:hypothetical protein
MKHACESREIRVRVAWNLALGECWAHTGAGHAVALEAPQAASDAIRLTADKISVGRGREPVCG